MKLIKEKDKEMCSDCEIELAEYEYDEERYCGECLLNKLEKEEKIETWTVKHYMIDSEYYGNDNEDDFNEIVKSIAERFKINNTISTETSENRIIKENVRKRVKIQSKLSKTSRTNNLIE